MNDADRLAWADDPRFRPETWLPMLRRLIAGPVEEHEAITLNDGDPAEVRLIVEPHAIHVEVPVVEWHGPHTPILTGERRASFATSDLGGFSREAELTAAVEATRAERLAQFRASELTLKLEEGKGDPLRPTTAVGTRAARTPEQVRLAEIVAQLNDLFQGDLSEANLVTYATHITGKLIENNELLEQAGHNSKEQFALGDYRKTVIDAVIDGLDNYRGMASQVLNSERTRDQFADAILDAVYEGLLARRAAAQAVGASAGASPG